MLVSSPIYYKKYLKVYVRYNFNILYMQTMWQQLSAVSIVLFIAAGVQTILLLFMFAKRQIMRFTLRSRRGPHTPIAFDTKKSLQKEIDRRIRGIPKVRHEPQIYDSVLTILNNSQEISHYYRLKAMSDMKILELQIKIQDIGYKSIPIDNLRGFLLSLLPASLNGPTQHMVHQFCDLYEHARHNPSQFNEEEYKIYSAILLDVSNIFSRHRHSWCGQD